MIGTNIGQMCRFVLQTPVTIFAWVKNDHCFALKMLRSSKVINELFCMAFCVSCILVPFCTDSVSVNRNFSKNLHVFGCDENAFCNQPRSLIK